jgi:transcriptional regulator GlxA family with amidase domain
VHLVQHQGAVRKEIKRLPASKRSTREELYKRLLTGKAYIEAHLQDSVSMDEVARQACLSTYHFIRRFGQAFGISPYQYLMKIRLEKSAILLANTELLIRHIASDVGMGDIHLFSRQFKRHFGISPSQYRGKACS